MPCVIYCQWVDGGLVHLCTSVCVCVWTCPSVCVCFKDRCVWPRLSPVFRPAGAAGSGPSLSGRPRNVSAPALRYYYSNRRKLPGSGLLSFSLNPSFTRSIIIPISPPPRFPKRLSDWLKQTDVLAGTLSYSNLPDGWSLHCRTCREHHTKCCQSRKKNRY